MKFIYNILYAFFILLNKLMGRFRRGSGRRFINKIFPYFCQIRFLLRSFNIKKFGKNCGLGSNVYLNCPNIILGDRVFLRDGVSIAGNGIFTIGSNTTINANTYFACMKSISIGDNVMFASFVYVFDVDHNFSKKDIPITKQGYSMSEVVIGNDVWIGTNTIVTKGISIGDGAIVAGNSVVVSDVKPFNIYGEVLQNLLKKGNIIYL